MNDVYRPCAFNVAIDILVFKCSSVSLSVFFACHVLDILLGYVGV
jgi:hypothetical protein